MVTRLMSRVCIISLKARAHGVSRGGLRGNTLAMDLTKDYPRSPREQLDGIMILPRAIDKARAQLEGKLGEYLYFG